MKNKLLYILFVFGFQTIANAQYENHENPLQNYLPDFVVVSKDNIAYYEEAFFRKAAINPEELQKSLADLLKEYPELSRSVKNGTGTVTTHTTDHYQIETPYVKNKINGLRVITDNKNGYLAMEIPYTNGLINGVVKEYIGRGVLYAETNYKNGIRNGARTVRYTIKHNSRDSFTVVGQYVNGSLENRLTIYTQDMKVLYPADFSKGLVEAYDGSFLWLSYSITANGNKHGKYEVYSITNDTKARYSTIIAHFNMDKLDGAVEKYNTKGKLTEKNEFKNGKPVGDFVTYDQNGTLKFKATYDQNGKRNGLTTVYSASGKIYQTIMYRNDEKEGYQTYYSDGEISAMYPYKNGRLNGRSFQFNDNGDTAVIGEYENDKNLREISFFKSGKIKLIYFPGRSYTYYDKEGNMIWTNKYEGEKSIGTIKSINYNRDEDYFIYMVTEFDSNGKKSVETNYNANGSYQRIPWQGQYYKQGIGETKSAAGKIETDYYFKGKKVSKEEYETKMKEQRSKE